MKKHVQFNKQKAYLYSSKINPIPHNARRKYAETVLRASPKTKESTVFTNNVVIFSDSMMNFNRNTKYKINKGLQIGRAQFIYFPGATSKELLDYTDRTLELFRSSHYLHRC